jgi:hypothetical protein
MRELLEHLEMEMRQNFEVVRAKFGFNGFSNISMPPKRLKTKIRARTLCV